MAPAIFTRLSSPSCSPIILYNFGQLAQLRFSVIVLICSCLCFWGNTSFDSASHRMVLIFAAGHCIWPWQSSHLMLLGILDVTSQNSPQWNLYLIDPCHTEVFIYKIYKEVMCIFPNLSFCLWRLCSYGIQKWFLLLAVYGNKDVLC